MGQCRTIGPPYCGVAARQRNITQVSASLERSVASQQHLSAPNGSIRAKTCSIEAKANYRLVACTEPNCLFGHQRCHVGVVVLYGDDSAPTGMFVCPSCRQVAGMSIAGQGLRPEAKQPLK